MAYEMYPHQEALLEILTERPQYAIFWEPRVMKTLPVALHLTNLLMEGKIQDALIIAPKAALGAWKQTFESFGGKRSLVVSKVKLVNYQLVWRRDEYDRFFDAVVLDESHNISHRTSRQSKFILKYPARSTYRYLLSGTPMGQGRLEDLYTQMEFLQPGFFGSWREFLARYCITRRLQGTYVDLIVGYRNKEELVARVGTMSSSLRLKDVVDLPRELPPDLQWVVRTGQTILKEVKEGYVAKYDTVIPNPLTKMMKMRQIASGFFIDEKGDTHEVNRYKEVALIDLLGEILPEKLVIFCDFTHSVDVCRKVCKTLGVGHLVLDGRQKDKEIWREFQEYDNFKVMICQYGSANAGIDLYSAHHLLFFEPSLSTTMTEQAKARIRFAKQEHPCAYHWFLTEWSIEDQIYKALEQQRDFAEETFVQWSMTWRKR